MGARSPPLLLVGGAVAAFAGLASGHALPRATEPPPPERRPPGATPAPAPRGAGTVCGYIGGDAALPATCAAGSHCAVDVAHGVVGCCPDGRPCDGGVFTACVDGGSGPQAVADPYVFTCRGRDVCYRNSFDGGLYQYGCGSASRLATSVATSAPGRAALRVARVTLAMTASPTRLATPVVVGFPPPPPPSAAAAPLDGRPSPSSSPPSSPGDKDGSPPAAPEAPGSRPRTGAIVGGTVGAVAGLVFLVALVLVLCRRRRRGGREEAPQYGGRGGPMGEHHRFEPLPSSHLDPYAGAGASGIARAQPTAAAAAAAAASQPRYPDVAADGSDFDRIPLNNNEADVFSPAYDSPRPAPRPDDGATEALDPDAGPYPGPRRNGGGALWQQNRRQHRNLVWI